MNTIYLERCIVCKSKKLYPEFEGGKLVCQNCGTVGQTEQLSDTELDELAKLLQTTTLPPEIQELLDQYAD